MQLSNRGSFYFVLLLFWVFLSRELFAQVLYQLPASTLGLKGKQFDFYIRGFTMSEGIDDGGDIVGFADGDGYSRLDGGGEFRYGFTRNLELRAGLNARRVSTIFGSQDTITNQGLESAWAGAKYQIGANEKSTFHFALDVSYRHATFSNTIYDSTPPPTDEIVLGDDGNEVRVGAIISHLWSRNLFISASAHYVKPMGNAPSNEIALNVELAYSKKNWSLILGMDMIKTLGQDEFEGMSSLKPKLATGPSFFANSINREMMAPYGTVEYALSETWKIVGSLGQVMSGKSIDKGTEFGLHLSWHSKGVSQAEQKITRFKEYNLEATVIKISPRGKFLKIDKGLSNDVEKGMRFDIFQTDFFGGNILVASGVAYEVNADSSIIKLERRYNNIEIKAGFAARAQ